MFDLRNWPFPRYAWIDWLNAKVASTCIYKTCSWEIETNDSMIIILFPSAMSVSNQSWKRGFGKYSRLSRSISPYRGCLYGGGPALLVGLGLIRGLDFTWEKPALLPELTTFIFPRNPESDICVHVFILYPTHKQTELVKWKVIKKMLAKTTFVVCTELCLASPWVEFDIHIYQYLG